MTATARTCKRLLTCLLLALACGASKAQVQATPWSYFVPIDINEAPKGGKPIVVMSAQADGPSVPLPASYFEAVGTPRGAVVIVNAAGGWTDAREGHFGRSLSSAGYGVLAIDSYGPRGIPSTLIDNARLSMFVQARDAFAARRFLVAQGHAPDRIAVLGTGRAGTVALLAADRTFMPDEVERFNLAMAISPACIFHPVSPKPAANVYMALADMDDLSGLKPCEDLARGFAAAGGNIRVKVYRGASGSFDGHPAMVRKVQETFAETFTACEIAVGEDGRAVIGPRLFGENDFRSLIAEMRKVCMGKKATSWTNLTQKATLTLDIIDFLDGSFRR